MGLVGRSRLAINSPATYMQIRIDVEMECRCSGRTPMTPALCIRGSLASDFGPNTSERFQVRTDEVAGP